MRFQRGISYPHPPRGPASKPYTMSDAALRQRRRNLRRTRLRSDRESLTIKLLTWQACFKSGPRPSQRALARQLCVWPSYVCKIQKQSVRGLDALASGRRVSLADLADARGFTVKLREQGLLASPCRLYGCEAPASREPRWMTTEGSSEQTWREVAEWKRKNSSDGHWHTLPEWREYERRGGRHVLFSVHVR